MNESLDINSGTNVKKDVQKKCEHIEKELNNLVEFYYNEFQENLFFRKQSLESDKINNIEKQIKEFNNDSINERFKKDENTQTYIDMKKSEYYNDLTFLKCVVNNWESMSEKVYDINEKVQDIKKNNLGNLNFTTYDDFKAHISKLIETIVFSRSELEDIKKQLIFDDSNVNKSSKYFISKITNNKKLKELKYSLESKYLRLSENLLNDIYIIEKEIPENIVSCKKTFKENEWNNDLKESFRNLIQNEEKLENRLNSEVKLDNLQELECDFKTTFNKCKYIDILIQSDIEGIYKKRFSSDLNQMNNLLKDIKNKLNNLKEVSQEYKLFQDSYLEHTKLLNSKNEKLNDLLKCSISYIEKTVDDKKKLKDLNNIINNFQKETYMKYNFHFQEYQQDIAILNQWSDYYRGINQNFEQENLKVEYKNIIEWKENIEKSKQEYQNNIKKLEFLNTYLIEINSLFKQKIKNNDYITIYITQLKRCEEFIKILNFDGVSSFVLTNITKCEKKIDKVLSAIDRKYSDINKEAINLYDQFVQVSNNEFINFLDFFSETYRLNVEKIFLNEEIKTFQSILRIRRKQFDKIFNHLKGYGSQINKKSSDIKNKFDFMFSNENAIFLKTIDESKKINKEKEDYQIYHQTINKMYNELKKELNEVTKKVKSELNDKWKDCCTDNNISFSELNVMPNEIKNWCYLNAPKSNDLEDMELCMKIENEFNNFINIFIEKWNILVDYKGRIDSFQENNKWEKLNENEITELEKCSKEISNIEITFKRLSEILTTSYSSISDKNASAIIDVQDTMVEKFENFKKNLLIINNKYIKVSSANIKNETTENFLKTNVEWCSGKSNDITDYKYSMRIIDLNPVCELYNCNFNIDSTEFEDYDISVSSIVRLLINNDNKILKEQNMLFNENYEIVSEKKLEFEKYFSTLLIKDFCIEKKQSVLEKFNKLKEDLQEWKIIISDYEMACDCKEYMLNMLFFINLMDKKLDTLHDLLEKSFESYEAFHKSELNLLNIKQKIQQFNYEIKRNILEHSKLINFKNKMYIFSDLNQLYNTIINHYNNMKVNLDKIESDYKKVSPYFVNGKNIIDNINSIKEKRKSILNNDTLLCFETEKSNNNRNECKNDIEKCKKQYSEMKSIELEKSFLDNHGITHYIDIIKKEVADAELYLKDSLTKENTLRLIHECNSISEKIDQNSVNINKEFEQGYVFEVYTDEIEDIYKTICKKTDENYSLIDQFSKNKYKIKDIINKNNYLLKITNIAKSDEIISKNENSYSNYKDNYGKKINMFRDHINELKTNKERLVRISKKINEIYNILSKIEENPKCAIEQHNGKLNLIKLIDENCQTLRKIFQSDIYKKYENSMYFHHYPIDLLEKFSSIKKLIIYSEMNDKNEDLNKPKVNNLSIEMEKHKEEIEISVETTVEEFKELLSKQEFTSKGDIYMRFSEVSDIFKNVIKQLQLEWIDLKDNYIDYISKKNVKANKDNIEYNVNVNHCDYLCNKIEKDYKEVESIFTFINNNEEILSEIFNLRKKKESLFDEFRTCLPIYKSLESLIRDQECMYYDIKECSKNEFKKWREDIQNYKKRSSKLIHFVQGDNKESTKFDEFIDIIKEKIQIDALINTYDKRLNQFSELFDSINKYYDKYQVNINSLIYILEHHISKENIINWKLFTINDKINYEVLQEIIDDHSLYESQYKKICDNHERKNNKYLKKIISSILNKSELTECGDPMNTIPLYIKEKLLDYFSYNGNIWNLKHLHKLWEIENDIYQVIINYKQLFKNLENVKDNIEDQSLSISQFEKNHNDKLIQYQKNINNVKEKYEKIKKSPSTEILRMIELLETKSQDMIHDSEVEIKKVIQETSLINNSMDKLNDDITSWCNNAKENLESITNDFFLYIIEIPINELASINYSNTHDDYNSIKSFINNCEENIVKNTINEIKNKKYEIDEIDFVLNHKKMVINNKINSYKGNIELKKSLEQLEEKRNDIDKLEEKVISFNNKYFFTMKMLKTYRNAINILFLIQYSDNILQFCKDSINNDVQSLKDKKLLEKLNIIKKGLFNIDFNNKMDELKSIQKELKNSIEKQDDNINYDFYNKLKNVKSIQKELNNNNVKTIQKELSFTGESIDNKKFYLSKFNDIIIYLDDYYDRINKMVGETETLVNVCIEGYNKYCNILKPFIEKYDHMLLNTEKDELKYNFDDNEKSYENKINNELIKIKKLYFSENVNDIFTNLNVFKSFSKNYKSVNNIVSLISKKLNEYYNQINLMGKYINYFNENINVPKNLRNLHKNSLNNKNQINIMKGYLNINLLENSKNSKEKEIKDNIVNKIDNTFKVNESLLETSEFDVKNLPQSHNKYIKEYINIVKNEFKKIKEEIKNDKNQWCIMNEEYKVIK